MITKTISETAKIMQRSPISFKKIFVSIALILFAWVVM